MKTHFYLLTTVLVVAIGVLGCKGSKKITQQEQTVSSSEKVDRISALNQMQLHESALKRDTEAKEGTARVHDIPNVIIYKTKADYSKNVPVGLNHEKTAITSYPGKTDIKYRKMPMPLEYGYLLDSHGIGLNVAFLKYTCEEYLALEEIPSIAELFNDIIDADPLTEMYNCGKTSDFQQGNVAEQLNKMLLRSEGKPEDFFRKLK